MSASLATVTFDYTGSEQTYTVPIDGWYRIELFGAGGGKAVRSGTVVAANPGKGGWSMGVAYLKKNTTLYINVGGKGADAVIGQHSAGGYNGGGNGAWDNGDDECCGAGGGATSVALVSGLLSTLSSQRDKVLIVSGGGGGASSTNGGGNAGGLSGADGCPRPYGGDYGKGGTQTTGFAFGKGEDATDYSIENQEVAGGGGGWYGGTCGVPTAASRYLGGGGGGSSYIGGVISACGETKGTIVMSTGGYGNGAAYIRLLMPDINKLYLSPSGTAQKVKSDVILGDGTAHHIDKLYIGDSNNVPQLVWVSYD